MSIRNLDQNELDHVSGGALQTQFVSVSSATSASLASKVRLPIDCWCGTCIRPPISCFVMNPQKILVGL